MLSIASINLLAVEYNVDTDKNNKVVFESDAPLESFTGTTERIDGYLLGNESDLSKDSEMYFEVDMNSVTTGIGLRDRHMRENYLETVDYPFASFTGKVIDAKKADDGWDVTVKGDFEIHGKKNPMTINGKMIKTNDGYKVQTNFKVALTDHDIEVPSIMFKKIDENMAVELEFFLKKV
jgi:polyisoprenoid-binding protein YceI